MHVDTGLGPLDHHQTSDRNVCGMSKTWDYVQKQLEAKGKTLTSEHLEAVGRIVKVVVDIDHLGEVFWKDAVADYQEFSLLGVLEGLKCMRAYQDVYYAEFGFICLNALLAEFENRIWAEKEIGVGKKFDTRYGRGIGFDHQCWKGEGRWCDVLPHRHQRLAMYGSDWRQHVSRSGLG